MVAKERRRDLAGQWQQIALPGLMDGSVAKEGASVSEADEPGSGAQPFDLLLAMCQVLSHQPDELSPAERRRQLAVAKRLIACGLTEDDVRAITAWLRDQSWLTSGIDLFVIERYLSRWTLSGRPRAAVAASALTMTRALCRGCRQHKLIVGNQLCSVCYFTQSDVDDQTAAPRAPHRTRQP